MDITLHSNQTHPSFDEWHRAYALKIAREQLIELGEEHWDVLHIVRDFYRETGISPNMRPLVKLLGTRGSPQLASSLELMRLFGGNPATTIAELAGLPKPVNCL